MACVCGDLRCHQCGPAQGNHPCCTGGPGTLEREEAGVTPVTVNPVTGCCCTPEQMAAYAAQERGRVEQERALARWTVALHNKNGDWWWEQATPEDEAG